ncbi:hypothetical protein ACLOJK_014586, partial [Asimina triloba]
MCICFSAPPKNTIRCSIIFKSAPMAAPSNLMMINSFIFFQIRRSRSGRWQIQMSEHSQCQTADDPSHGILQWPTQSAATMEGQQQPINTDRRQQQVTPKSKEQRAYSSPLQVPRPTTIEPGMAHLDRTTISNSPPNSSNRWQE